jgi:hypothetical protein
MTRAYVDTNVFLNVLNEEINPKSGHNIQLVQIQPEERLAATSELNPASSLVTGCGEARGMGYWAATQVKGLSHEVFIVPETLSF